MVGKAILKKDLLVPSSCSLVCSKAQRSESFQSQLQTAEDERFNDSFVSAHESKSWNFDLFNSMPKSESKNSEQVLGTQGNEDIDTD